MHFRSIPLNNPVFYIQHIDSVNSPIEANNLYLFTFGCQPIFNLEKFKQSKLLLKKVIEKKYLIRRRLDFIIDDSEKLSVINYRFKEGEYEPSTLRRYSLYLHMVIKLLRLIRDISL